MSVKSLPHKQEDLSSVCRMHIKSQTGGMCLDNRTRETDRQAPGTPQAGRALSLRPGLHSEDLSPKRKQKTKMDID